MTDKKIISWTEYHHLIEQLALQIYRSGWSFNAIVCLARGGLRVGDILSRIFACPLAILATSSYQNHHRGRLTIAHSMTMTLENLPDGILLVDDLVDSGETILQTIEWLKHHYGITEIKTAVLWYKTESKHLPDYYIEAVAEHIWIEQPFELYENFSLTKVKDLIDEDWDFGIQILARLPVNRNTNSLLLAYLIHLGAIDADIEQLFNLSCRCNPSLCQSMKDYFKTENNTFDTVTDAFIFLSQELEPYGDQLDFNGIVNTLLPHNRQLLSYCLARQTAPIVDLLSCLLEDGGTTLNLRDLGLTAIPGEIGNLTNLRYLDIGENPIEMLPDEFARLTNLEYLYFDHTNLGHGSLLKLELWLPQLMAHKYFYNHVVPQFNNTKRGSEIPSIDRLMEANQWLDRCLELDPTNPNYLNTKGVILQRIDRLKEALTYFDRALSLDPNNALAYSNKSYNLFLQHQYQLALDTALVGLELSKKDGEGEWQSVLYFRAGQALYHMKSYPEAEQMYLKAITLDPEDGGSYYNLACIYAINQEREKVIAYLAKAVAKDYSFLAEARQDSDLSNYYDDLDFWQQVDPQLQDEK